MNQFFLDKVAAIKKGLINTNDHSLSACSRIMDKKGSKLTLQYVTVSKVHKLQKNLKSSKCSAVEGHDNHSL